MKQQRLDPVGLESPDDPAGEEDHGHGGGHIQVGIAATQQGSRDFEAMLAGLAPTDGSDTWNETKPIGKQDEDEHRGEEPERLLNKVGAYNAFQELVERLHKPLEEVLGTRGCEFHLPRGVAGKKD